MENIKYSNFFVSQDIFTCMERFLTDLKKFPVVTNFMGLL